MDFESVGLPSPREWRVVRLLWNEPAAAVVAVLEAWSAATHGATGWRLFARRADERRYRPIALPEGALVEDVAASGGAPVLFVNTWRRQMVRVPTFAVRKIDERGEVVEEEAPGSTAYAGEWDALWAISLPDGAARRLDVPARTAPGGGRVRVLRLVGASPDGEEVRAVIARERPWTEANDEREPLIGKALHKKYGFAMRPPEGTLAIDYVLAGISLRDGAVRDISMLSTPFA